MDPEQRKPVCMLDKRRVWKMIKKFREEVYDIFHQRTEITTVQIERISCFGRRQHLSPTPSFWITTRL